MGNARSCKRMILASAEGCRVIFCEDCKIAELEFGVLSVRIELSVIYHLQSVLDTATRKLSV